MPSSSVETKNTANYHRDDVEKGHGSLRTVYERPEAQKTKKKKKNLRSLVAIDVLAVAFSVVFTWQAMVWRDEMKEPATVKTPTPAGASTEVKRATNNEAIQAPAPNASMQTVPRQTGVRSDVQKITVSISDHHPDTCGVWFAPSTILGAGWGMFAGRDFAKKEKLLPSGDVEVPLFDISEIHGDDFNFLWDEYTWTASSQLMNHEARTVDAFSTGLGAAVNCFLDMNNIDEDYPTNDGSSGLNRNRDPGAGAFTAYHDRNAEANEPIGAGQELFASYGDNWFKTRNNLKDIPRTGDMKAAQHLLNKKRHLRGNITLIKEAIENNMTVSERVRSALPKSLEEYEIALNIGLKGLRQQQTTRSTEWLEEHGTCVDNIREGPSTVPQAGRGAFATRFMEESTVVAPVPLIHTSYRDVFDIYQVEEDEITGENKVSQPMETIGRQLLLNYCFGHRDSSLLLSPYGFATSLLNHNRTLANVKLRWADPNRSNHHPEWLDWTVEDLDELYTAGLAFEYVATRDIELGEEIFLDYGEAWEKAWERHKNNWIPPRDLNSYVPAKALNDDLNLTALLKEGGFPDNILLMCYFDFWKDKWREALKSDGNLDKLINKSEYYNCNITSWKVEVGKKEETNRYDKEEKVLFSVIFPEGRQTMEDVPKEAFVFVDKPYTTDMHLRSAFRHEIMIPDELMPEAWKNLLMDSNKTTG